MDGEIDIVVMWVDGNDPAWRAEKAKYDVKDNADGTVYRYRDWGLLKYWFRGVEQFAPWVRKVHFVTWGHVPEWLNVNHPKLNIVRHEDFIPKEYLPTFSANTIENNLHRIKGLAEKFVLFNDDFYLISTTKAEDFFEGDLPKDTVALNVCCPQKSLISRNFDFNNTGIVNEHFDFKKSMKENRWKWYNLKNGKQILRTVVLEKCPRFPGFWQHHLASAFKKSTFEEVWRKEPEILDQTCRHKFRESTDVTQWLFKDWQIASGKFAVRTHKFGRAFYIDRDGLDKVGKEILRYITRQRGKIVVINDGEMKESEFDKFRGELKVAFEKILPEKSEYERNAS